VVAGIEGVVVGVDVVGVGVTGATPVAGVVGVTPGEVATVGVPVGF
jgi:hypothetical protein